MNRREFNKVLGSVGVGLVAGARAMAQDAKKPDTAKKADEKKPDTKKAEDKAPKHVCKGFNECKAQGGCKTGDAGCAAKNSCKGKGGCATSAHHDCRGKNDCKGQGGCKTSAGCFGKNECKGKGGCAVPVKDSMKK
jgi:hypothetical protein